MKWEQGKNSATKWYHCLSPPHRTMHCSLMEHYLSSKLHCALDGPKITTPTAICKCFTWH